MDRLLDFYLEDATRIGRVVQLGEELSVSVLYHNGIDEIADLSDPRQITRPRRSTTHAGRRSH